MKIVTVSLGMLFAAATLQAQIPLYPYLYPQPYVYSQPDPFAVPYSGPYYYLSPFSAPMQFAAQYPNLLNDVYRNCQAEQCRAEVQQLRDELARTQAQAQQPPSPPTTTSSPPRPSQPVVLVFNNGQRVESTGVVVTGRTLRFLTSVGYDKVDVSTLNIQETQNENRRRGIDFPTPRPGR
jgi:hypothetical protein